MSRSADHFASWCPFHGIWVLVMVMWCNPWQDLLVILSHWLPEWEAMMLSSKTEIEQVTWLMMNSTIHTKRILCYSGCPHRSWINSVPGQVHIFCRQWDQRLVSEILPRRWNSCFWLNVKHLPRLIVISSMRVPEVVILSGMRLAAAGQCGLWGKPCQP